MNAPAAAPLRLPTPRERVAFTVAQAVGEAFGINPDELFARRRFRDVAEARFAAVALLRELAGWSHMTIGDHFFRSDYTSSIHAQKRARILAGIDSRFAAKLASAREQLLPFFGQKTAAATPAVSTA